MTARRPWIGSVGAPDRRRRLPALPADGPPRISVSFVPLPAHRLENNGFFVEIRTLARDLAALTAGANGPVNPVEDPV